MSEPVLEVSEIFRSLQGEGPSVGAPAVFLRLGVCNLRCAWCDTPYTWDFARYDYDAEVTERSVGDVRAALEPLSGQRLVITGGEPMLQQTALAALLAGLDASVPVEVETNGTLAPEPALSARVDQWNVSPKLANSGEPERRRLIGDALASLRDTGRAFLKLVIESADDLGEADALVKRLSWPLERVVYMPQASTPELLAERSPWLAEACRERGVRFSTRLHVALWGARRGV